MEQVGLLLIYFLSRESWATMKFSFAVDNALQQ